MELGQEPRKPSHLAVRLAFVAAIVAVGGAMWWLREAKAASIAAERDPERSLHPYRLAIKLTLDPEAKRIPSTPKASSLAAIVGLPHPSNPSVRLDPLETTKWIIDAEVESVILKPDGDIVFEISAGGIKATAEIPDPKLCAGSPFLVEITAVRDQVVGRFHPERKAKPVHLRAQLTGIGFAGMPGGGTPEGVRIYPALSIRWEDPSGSAR